MLLEQKTAVIYGAGAIGGAVARAFAREGAHVFLTGRSLAPLEAVARDIAGAGGAVETALVDAQDGQSVTRHLEAVVSKAGRLDISFNAISIPHEQGVPLVELGMEDFTAPIAQAMRTQFVTARAAARHMIKQRAGVILAITATPARAVIPYVGPFGVMGAAIEGLCRQLAGELGPSGIRVVCLRSAGSPDTPGMPEVFEAHGAKLGISAEAFGEELVGRTLLKRLPLLAEVANVAALMASDQASAMTGTVANVTCGQVVD
ncbi:MAG: short-chain dehydrogenase [Chloroflexi bacterium]|nr:MAG: short-chain dehydrogenase [Chloroflexota bacterium]